MKQHIKTNTVYAFIDSQNLNLGVRSQGWKLDWRKFRQYLRNKYNVGKAYLFIGQLAGKDRCITGFFGAKKRLAFAVGRNLRLVQSS